MEKQRDKAARRMQRKAEKHAGHVEPEHEVTTETEPTESVKTADTTF